jgi:hypothetical protein
MVNSFFNRILPRKTYLSGYESHFGIFGAIKHCQFFENGGQLVGKTRLVTPQMVYKLRDQQILLRRLLMRKYRGHDSPHTVSLFFSRSMDTHLS